MNDGQELNRINFKNCISLDFDNPKTLLDLFLKQGDFGDDTDRKKMIELGKFYFYHSPFGYIQLQKLYALGEYDFVERETKKIIDKVWQEYRENGKIDIDHTLFYLLTDFIPTTGLFDKELEEISKLNDDKFTGYIANQIEKNDFRMGIKMALATRRDSLWLAKKLIKEGKSQEVNYGRLLQIGIHPRDLELSEFPQKS